MTPRFGFPYIAADQAQKHVPHNSALDDLDALLAGVVLSATTTTAPVSPAEGDSYIVPAGATGFDPAVAGQLATWRAGAWSPLSPPAGLARYVLDTGAMLRFDGAAWAPLQVDMLGINATPDALNRLAVASDAVLFTHDPAGSGDQRVKVNKAAALGTAAHLFQTGFSGRAEFGLLGSDDFSVKVSPDGAAWTEALRIDRTTGVVSFPAGTSGAGAPLICQLRNNDTTTDLNTAALADIPLNGVEDFRDIAAFERLGAGVKCLVAGRVRVSASVHMEGTWPNQAVAIQVAVNGVPVPGIGQSSYIRHADGNHTASSALTRWITVAANDAVTIQGARAGDGGVVTMTAGDSVLLVEQWA